MKKIMLAITAAAFAVMAAAAAIATPVGATPRSPIEFYSQGAEGYKALAPGKKARERAGRAGGAALASKYIGSNPTKMRRLWCANFVNLVEKKAGRPGTGSNFALSFKKYGKAVPLSQARANDIVVFARKGGGHVGYVVEPPKNGKIKVVSGNSGGKSGKRRVTVSYYSVKRVVAVRRV